MKKILAYVMLALIASLWGCSDMGDRDNPTDPSADNYDASLVPGGENGGDSVDPGDGGNSSDGGEGDDGKGSSSSNGISSNSSSSKGSSSSVGTSNPAESSSNEKSSSSSAVPALPPCKTSDSDDCEYGFLTDARDGQTYKTVKIGDQWWMAENLNFDYNVGSAKSYCYGQAESNCEKYGRLYTWAAAMDSSAAFSNSAAGCGYLVDCSLSYPVRGVCPEGWILPDSTDMVKLIKAVGNYSAAGSVLRSVSQGGTDSYGFNLMMAGMLNISGNYVNKDAVGYLWTSHPRGRYNADHILFEKVASARYYNNYRYNSYSVRCLKN